MKKLNAKTKKVQRILIIFIGISCIFLCLFLWKLHADKHIYELPNYDKTDISMILEKYRLINNDFKNIYLQTGLSEMTIKKLLEKGNEELIYDIQDRFFLKTEPECMQNSIISWEEWNKNETERIIFADFEDGDILITPCSHTFGWRNGHAAIVVDAEKKQTLESVVLGEKSAIQSIKKWEKYPCVMVLRLKGISKEERMKIAQNAKTSLTGVDYGFDMGFLTPKYKMELLERTHCAHLVWYAFRHFGYDLDSDGGIIVTPKDLANSPLLEVVQVVGLNPLELWE